MEVPLSASLGACKISELEVDDTVESEHDILKHDIIDYVAHDTRQFFKSQQLTDPELTNKQKTEIATQIFDKSKSIFLSRFGRYLTNDHLKYFDQFAGDDDYEMKFYLNEIRRLNSVADRVVDVKNRRYEAMKKMIAENSYFTEVEMMRREPLLYDQLIGKFLSEKEIVERDKEDTTNMSFVNILLKGIDRDQTRDLKEAQKEAEEAMEEEEEEEEYDVSEMPVEMKPIVQKRSNWGEMDGSEETFVPINKPLPISQPSVSGNTQLTAEEKNLLKEEFVTAMYSNFIDGKDANFDYSAVDFNPEFDCIDIRSRDEEEKYFDSEDINDDDLHDDTFHEDQLEMEKDCLTLTSDEEGDPVDVYLGTLAKESGLPVNIFPL